MMARCHLSGSGMGAPSLGERSMGLDRMPLEVTTARQGSRRMAGGLMSWPAVVALNKHVGPTTWTCLRCLGLLSMHPQRPTCRQKHADAMPHSQLPWAIGATTLVGSPVQLSAPPSAGRLHRCRRRCRRSPPIGPSLHRSIAPSLHRKHLRMEMNRRPSSVCSNRFRTAAHQSQRPRLSQSHSPGQVCTPYFVSHQQLNAPMVADVHYLGAPCSGPICIDCGFETWTLA